MCNVQNRGLHSVNDLCFAELIKGSMTKLLAFGESVAMSKKSSERLLRVLDMYETLWDLMPDIDTVYCHESCARVRTQAFMTLHICIYDLSTHMNANIPAQVCI
jgi:exocyst complex protein 7